MNWEWHITESNTGEESPWITITDSFGNWIAEIPDDDRIEDARLIAAAPQLLEACELAFKWIDKNALHDDITATRVLDALAIAAQNAKGET